MVGGVEGSYDSPARGLYPRLASELVAEGVSVLRVRFRFPTVLDEAHHDVVAGVDHLTAAGVGRVALVGHSFGGAAVIAAAVDRPAVVAVCTLSTQSYGTEAATRLGAGPCCWCTARRIGCCRRRVRRRYSPARGSPAGSSCSRGPGTPTASA